jgi:hypothetical protein
MMVSASLRRLLVLVGLLALPVSSQAQSGAASIEVDVTPPSGYVARLEGGLLWVKPPAPQPATSCIYGISPPRPSKGSLNADADAALVDETVGAGMKRTSESRIGMRGVAPDGWQYFLSGGSFQAQNAGGYAYLTVIAMAIPATASRVSVILVLGNAAQCNLNDVPFAQFLHGLRPRGWSSPGGNALERDLIGEWQGSMLSGHTFFADGRYTSSAAGMLQGKPISGGVDGRYALRGSEVTITPSATGQRPERFRVHVYDNWTGTRWQRAMSVLYDERQYVAEYIRAGQ